MLGGEVGLWPGGLARGAVCPPVCLGPLCHWRPRLPTQGERVGRVACLPRHALPGCTWAHPAAGLRTVGWL